MLGEKRTVIPRCPLMMQVPSFGGVRHVAGMKNEAQYFCLVKTEKKFNSHFVRLTNSKTDFL